MKIETIEIKEHDIKEIRVNAHVRYFEDSEVNGVEDTDGTLIPCRIEDSWCPVINADTGIIKNWREGVSASICYKVCDECGITLMDEDNNVVVTYNNYVPDLLCIGEDNDGDYIIMKIDTHGHIKDWDSSKIQALVDDTYYLDKRQLEELKEYLS